jgi:hypothetical protein
MPTGHGAGVAVAVAEGLAADVAASLAVALALGLVVTLASPSSAFPQPTNERAAKPRRRQERNPIWTPLY